MYHYIYAPSIYRDYMFTCLFDFILLIVHINTNYTSQKLLFLFSNFIVDFVYFISLTK